MSKLFLRNWLLIVPISLLVFGSVLLVMAAPGEPYNIFAPPEALTGFVPLASFEVESALAMAKKSDNAQQRSADKTETLLIERHQEEKSVYASGSWDRRADVYVYDYGTDSLIYTIVNLTSGAIDHEETVQGVQLPFNMNEMARMTEILLADETIGQQLHDHYGLAFAGRRASAADLDVAPFVFLASSHEEIVDGPKMACGIQRCAELLINATDNLLIPFNPIVNLSTGEVIGIAGQ